MSDPAKDTAVSITALGYIGFQVRDLDAWTVFATEVLGMAPGEPHGEERRFRLDGQAWRIAIEQGEADDLVFAGYEVAGAEELKAVAARLTAGGVAVADGSPELRAARGVTGLKTVTDPDGLAVEIYYGPTLRYEQPFASPAGVSSFVTGEQGLGHVVLAAPDIARTRAFYVDLLGFRLSDIIRMKITPEFAIDLEFYHCNARRHTLALAPIPAPKRMNHFMLQVPSLDDVGFALERAEKAGVPIAQTLGRHSNDHMISFYARTPSGFEVEFGYGAREIDEAAWRVERHDAASLWGHKRTGA